MPGETPALALPDALIVRYFRAGELDEVTAVENLDDGRIKVQVDDRTDLWRDLGGGVGYVPDAD
jgi:hypothetical protein